MPNFKLFKGDCLEVMPTLADKSVDVILCDLPYGTTACKWDTIIPFDILWEQYNRLIKDDGAIVLFGSEPFSSYLRLSNIKYYKYDWTWDKHIPSGMTYAKYRPMQQTENISVFSSRTKFIKYNPIMIKRDRPQKSGGNKVITENYIMKCKENGEDYNKIYYEKYPITLLHFNKIRQGSLHPTQKPVELCEYLIKTYTNEGDLVLDNCMGSGTTGVACVNTKRSFIGIEKEENYFQIAKERIEKEIKLKKSELVFC
jgi:site-specific DNA-methyltransferase (adenine-specific)